MRPIRRDQRALALLTAGALLMAQGLLPRCADAAALGMAMAQSPQPSAPSIRYYHGDHLGSSKKIGK